MGTVRSPRLCALPLCCHAVGPRATGFPLRGSNCTCLTGVSYESELINAHKATLRPWSRAKYHSCCYDLLGNAISLISESSQPASPYPSHCPVPVCTLPWACSRRASSHCLPGRRQQHSASAPCDHLYPLPHPWFLNHPRLSPFCPINGLMSS